MTRIVWVCRCSFPISSWLSSNFLCLEVDKRSQHHLNKSQLLLGGKLPVCLVGGEVDEDRGMKRRLCLSRRNANFMQMSRASDLHIAQKCPPRVNVMKCVPVCRMEETVRSLLQNQGVLEQTAVDTVDIMKAYKVNCELLISRFSLIYCIRQEPFCRMRPFFVYFSSSVLRLSSECSIKLGKVKAFIASSVT